MVRDTLPFAFPCTFVLSAVAERKSRIDQVTQDYGILLDLILAKEGGVALRQRRDDTQRQADRRVATQSGGVVVRVEALSPYLLRSLATEDIRQLMLADGVHDADGVFLTYLDMQRIDGVAGQERVAQDRVVEIGLVIEGHAFRQTSLQVDHRVHRCFHRQLQREEIRDHARGVEDRIVVDTAGGFLQVVVMPDERLRISRRVELAQRQEIAPLLNEVEEIYPVALVRVAGKNGIRRETELVYLFLMPYIRQRLIVIQDLRLVMQRHALLHDLDQDHAVAHIICHTGTIERVTIYYSRQVVSVIIIDTVDTHALAFTELIAIYAFRYFVDRQVQTIDAVRAIYRGIAVFVLVGGADSVLQRVGLMLYRTFRPEERQIRLAYRRVLLKQVRRIDDQHQLLAVIATAFRLRHMVIRPRAGQQRVRLDIR